jgi:hypothetical protein
VGKPHCGLSSRAWWLASKVWLRKQRGASDPTIKLYARDAAHLMAALGDDPEKWEPAAIRSFFLDRASHFGNGTVEKLTTSLCAFLQYLAVEGRCRAGLADVVPGYARWRPADLPRCLAAEQVNRLIAACDSEVVARSLAADARENGDLKPAASPCSAWVGTESTMRTRIVPLAILLCLPRTRQH